MTVSAWEFAAAAALEAAFGDPRWMPHPIRGIGWLITRAETFWRWTKLPLRFAGVCLWMSVAGVSTTAVWATLPWMNIYWIWMLLAARGLDAAALTVVRALERGDLDDARAKLAMIVGRDTATLDEAEIMRAVIETVSENTSDAIVAPVFYLVIGGPAAMAALQSRQYDGQHDRLQERALSRVRLVRGTDGRSIELRACTIDGRVCVGRCMGDTTRPATVVSGHVARRKLTTESERRVS